MQLSHLQTWCLMSYSALCQREEFYWMGARIGGVPFCSEGGGGRSRKEVSLFPELTVFPGTLVLGVTSPVHFLGRRSPTWARSESVVLLSGVPVEKLPLLL